MPTTYSVGELTAYIRDLFDQDDRLQSVWVSGEISNLSMPASGHWYFTLKDRESQIKCVVWRSTVQRINFRPSNGDQVVLHGKLSIYEPQGIYQIYADAIRPQGVGDLYQQYERLKASLEAEGLFDASRKRPLPAFPLRIGIVTSSEAAAFQDVQNILRRRFPLADVILSPTLVQGMDAPPQICTAIERLNRYGDLDVIIVCRGGGSIEDLWAFNDERVARAIAASAIPIVSGVGHETDFTIADFAADLRAPTPSAAAELVTPSLDDLREAIAGLTVGLDVSFRSAQRGRREQLAGFERSLGHVSPVGRVRTYRQRIDDTLARMDSMTRHRFALLGERLASRTAALNAANPEAILARGYAIVTRREDGQPLTAADAVPGTPITIQLADGRVSGRIENEEGR